MQKKNKVFSWIIIGVCTVAIIWLSTSEAIKAKSYSQWKVYENNQWKFEFKYPPETKIEEISQDTLKLPNGGLISFKKNVNNYSLKQLCEEKEYPMEHRIDFWEIK